MRPVDHGPISVPDTSRAVVRHCEPSLYLLSFFRKVVEEEIYQYSVDMLRAWMLAQYLSSD